MSASGRRIAAAAALAALAGVSAAGAAGPTDSLQAQVQALQARARGALLDLYVLDTRMHAAQRRLSALEAQEASMRREEALLTRELSLTRHTLFRSQRLLATNLQALYKQNDVSALAVVLGARSLDDAVTKLDDLSRVADESKQIVAVTSAARVRLGTVRRTLHTRRIQLDAAVSAAERTTHDLAAARSNRLAFIADLRRRAQLASQQISALQQVAQKVEQKSDAIQAAAPAPAPEPAAAPAAEGGRTLTVSSTGYSLPGHTSTGLPVGFGVVAVDPAVIPLGTRLTVPGYGDAVAADTGSGVRGADIDLWFPTLAQARAWGRRTVTITLH